jgi:gliding motility-associated-like protein
VINLNPIAPIISYNWNSNNLDTPSFIDFPGSSIWYVVEVINSDGCIIKDSVFVNVYDYPIIDSIWATDSSLFKGEEIILTVTTENNIFWHDFSNTDYIQQFIAEVTECYLFEVYNQYNCLIKDSICIEVRDVFCDDKNIEIPTAFSPNEDGQKLNETYFIQDNDGIVTKFRLEIFNRFGQKVFEATEITDKWDGTFRGNKLAPQVFDFYLELECIGEKILFHKGNITLIR